MLNSIISGRPTRAQVDRLFEVISQMKEGELITHDKARIIIGEPNDPTRYRTVVGSLRRRLFQELGCTLNSERGIGYIRSEGFVQIKTGNARIRGGFKAARRGVEEIAAVSDERLPSPVHRRVRDHIVSQARTLAEMGRIQSKEFQLVIGKPESLPSPA